NRPSRRVDKRPAGIQVVLSGVAARTWEDAVTTLYPFRIHFADGTTRDVMSASADAVREEYKSFGLIDKVKVNREKDQ
ncbi:MAG: hypothetical protein KUL88_01735, partial [Rhizobium sp.]|nr:hypothetical protein [Rhizobium sp.]